LDDLKRTNGRLYDSASVIDERLGGRIMTRLFGSTGALLAVAGLLVFSTAAQAQTTTATTSTSGSVSSSRMWGSSSGNLTDSASLHAQEGSAAGQVNAAKLGLLVGAGPNFSITAIGSQSIVSTTIVGNSNSTNVNAQQTSTNTGDVTTNGMISASGPITTTSP
jgi:hypothetical protein